MASGFAKKDKPEPIPTEEPAICETSAVEPAEPVAELEPEEEKHLSDDVLANVLAVLGQTYQTAEDAQKAVNGAGVTYLQYKLGKYHSLQLTQVGPNWSWIAL